MISKRTGFVKSITADYGDMQEMIVQIDGKDEKAISYTTMTGSVSEGDKVLLNTTAVELGLGTGGFHFVIANMDNPQSEQSGGGHIMKLRYTPFQIKCFAVEEQESKYHESINDFSSLDGLAVAVGTLHSQLVPFACVSKFLDPRKKLTYIMTDGAALPMYLSKNVKQLSQKGLIDSTITCGNAFGGDYESVNIYSAIIFAKQVLKSDIIIVCMGPGIVGTGTKYGFTGIEQAHILDAVSRLGGRPVAIPRISFADKRERHYGISHHTITILKDIVGARVDVPVNIQDSQKLADIKMQLSKSGISKKHNIHFIEKDTTRKALDHYGMKVRSMGRSFEQDEEFFKAASGAAHHILEGLA